MSWEHWLLAAAAAIAVAAAFYFSMRGEQSSQKKSAATIKEPFFASRVSSRPAKSAAAEESESAIIKDAKNIGGDGGSSGRQSESSAAPQGALPMDDFTPPELPPPDESLLPLDMCYAVRLFGDSAVSAVKMEDLRARMRPAKSKNSYRLGFDEGARQWRLASDLSSRYWIVAAPLADRGGPIGESDIRRMEEAARAFAQKTKMRLLFPPASESLENAARIDKFCATADMFIELRLSGEDCADDRIAEAMHLAGMTADGARGFVRRMNSEELFRARAMPTPASAARRTIIFEMDAPNITSPPRAFEEMMHSVRRAAGLLNMQITDPKGQAVDEERAAAMREQISLLAAQMRRFGAEPGGAIARMIFS